nr:MarR family transcriptional regulator [Streptomyces sp. NBC_00830]
MSKAEVWRVVGQNTKAATFWSAAKWRQEAQRRSEIRVKTGPVLAGARAQLAAAQAANIPEAGKPHVDSAAVISAKRAVATAKRAHPDSMLWLSAKAAAGVGTAGWFGLPLVPGQVWLWSAVAVVAMAVSAVAWVVKRSPKPAGLEPTKEERQLLKRLDSKHWREHAEGRGLAGTITGKPTLGEGGIECAVRLDGTWTMAKFKAAGDNTRALLGVRTGLRMEVKAGKSGEWARLVLRTRSAADGDDLTWTPQQRTFGVDTVTGEQVTIPLGERLLIAGMSGAGKSVSSRPLMYDASEGPTNSLVILDLKKVEGRLWDHRARVASTPGDVVAVVAELVAEMTYRLDILPKGEDKWTPTPEHPRLTVVVDEGAEIVTAAKDALEGLESIARMGRAAAVDLWWMTQKPSIGDGIPKQIAPQMSTRICLAVSTPTEARVVLGEDAQQKGWHADSLDTPGFAMVRDGKRSPNPVQVRYMDKKVVIGLPEQPIWYGKQAAQKPPTSGHVPEQVNGSDAKVLDLVKRRPMAQKDIAEATGLPKGTVSKVVKRLMEAGQLVRHDDGLVDLAGTEVTA